MYMHHFSQVELFCVNHLINCSLESTEEFISMEFRFTLRDNGMRAAFQLLHMVLEVIPSLLVVYVCADFWMLGVISCYWCCSHVCSMSCTLCFIQGISILETCIRMYEF